VLPPSFDGRVSPRSPILELGNVLVIEEGKGGDLSRIARMLRGAAKRLSDKYGKKGRLRLTRVGR